MNRTLWLILMFTFGCSETKIWQAPEFTDEPQTVKASLKQIASRVPAYGISVDHGGGIEFVVNIEAEDAPKVRPGEMASAFILPDRTPIACRVSRALPNVSAETGQALASLRPLQANSIPLNEFIYAAITTSIKKNALTVPKEAVYVRDGRTWVIRKSKTRDGHVEFASVEVNVGESFDSDVEVQSGLEPNDEIVVQGGVGFLYPEFKVSMEEED